MKDILIRRFEITQIRRQKYGTTDSQGINASPGQYQHVPGNDTVSAGLHQHGYRPTAEEYVPTNGSGAQAGCPDAV